MLRHFSPKNATKIPKIKVALNSSNNKISSHFHFLGRTYLPTLQLFCAGEIKHDQEANKTMFHQNTRLKVSICSKLLMMTSEPNYWHRFAIFVLSAKLLLQRPFAYLLFNSFDRPLIMMQVQFLSCLYKARQIVYAAYRTYVKHFSTVRFYVRLLPRHLSLLVLDIFLLRNFLFQNRKIA